MDWPPINFVQDGRPTGFSVEYINLVAKKIGLEVRYVAGNWNELLQAAYDRKLDVMLNIVKTEERSKHLQFTRSYATTPMAIFVRPQNWHLKSINDLIGKRVAVVKGFYSHRYLEKHFPSIELETTTSTLEGIRAVSAGNADAMLDRLAVGNYLIAKNFITDVIVSGVTGVPELDRAEWCLGVCDDWPLLVSILQKGMDVITDDEFAKRRFRRFSHYDINRAIFVKALVDEEKYSLEGSFIKLKSEEADKRLKDEVIEK